MEQVSSSLQKGVAKVCGVINRRGLTMLSKSHVFIYITMGNFYKLEVSNPGFPNYSLLSQSLELNI